MVPCGVHLDPRPRFTICIYRNETDCIYFTYHTWHHLLDISYEQESEKCHSRTPDLFFCHIRKNYICHLSQMSKIINTPLIFVIESQSLCLYQCFQGQGNQFLHLFSNFEDFFKMFLVAAMQLICQGPIGPQHIFDYTDVMHAWNWRTLSEVKSQWIAWQIHKISAVMLMVFVLHKAMNVWVQIDPTRCYEG